MKREDKERGSKIGPPESFGETTPQFPGQNYDFMLQAVFDLKGTVSKLEQAISTLTDQQKENNTKIIHIEKVMYAGTAIVVIFGPLAGVLLSKLWELLFPFLKAHWQ